MRASLLFVCLALVSACASSPDHEQGNENQDVLTREEMVATDLTNLEEVVQRLRPEWYIRAKGGGGRIILVDDDLHPTGMGLGEYYDWREAGVYELEFVPERKIREALKNQPRRYFQMPGGAIIIRTRRDGGG